MDVESIMLRASKLYSNGAVRSTLLSSSKTQRIGTTMFKVGSQLTTTQASKAKD